MEFQDDGNGKKGWAPQAHSRLPKAQRQLTPRDPPHTHTPLDLVSKVPRHTYKTTADAKAGFHQGELDEESSRVTTFITKWGKYRYLRTTMGYCSSSDAFMRPFDDTIMDIPRKIKCFDDVLLYDDSTESAFWHT